MALTSGSNHSNRWYKFKSICQPDGTGGAILVLPKGYQRVDISRNLGLSLRSYAEYHMESWYNHANDLFPTKSGCFPSGSLKIIETCFQARIWAAAMLPPKEFPSENPQPQDHAMIDLKPLPDQTDTYMWNSHVCPPYFCTDGSSNLPADKEKFLCTIATEMSSLCYAKSGTEILGWAYNAASNVRTWSQDRLQSLRGGKNNCGSSMQFSIKKMPFRTSHMQ